MIEAEPVATRRFADAASIAIVIPVFNGLRHTRHCVESLRAMQGPEFMVVVVDDGSTDGTPEYLAENAPDVHVVAGTGDLWWSGGVNVGCRWAIARGADRLILLNNDNTSISPNLVADLDSTLSRTGGCVYGVALTRGGDGRVRVLMAGGTVDWRRRGLSLIGVGDEYVEQDRELRCDWLPGMALIFEAALFEELGGFDDRRLKQYKGDADFTLRATQAGYPCVASYRSWVLNDLSQTGLNFEAPVSPRAFAKALFDLKSNYHVPSTVAFALKHCPYHLVPWYLLQFYARYAYASLKSQRLRFRRPATQAA